MTEITSEMNMAIAIAIGASVPDPSEAGVTITAGKKDLNARGRGPHWYRMVYRKGRWIYVSPDRLPSGNFRASERRCAVYGEVYLGEIVACHDIGGPIDLAWLVVTEDPETCLWQISFSRLRDGQLDFTLPNGMVVTTKDPRQRNT